MKKVDLVGCRFGRLLVVERVGSKKRQSLWRCVCECGNEKITTLSHLKHGQTQSCGCLQKEVLRENGRKSVMCKRAKKHGCFGTKLYNVWAGMIRRCENPNQLHYSDYGGRGISVCEEWRNNFSTFQSWAIKRGYKEGLSIDRVDNNGNYEPDNCRWVTWDVQARNRRNSIKIYHNGKPYSLRQIAELNGLKVRTVVGRYERGDRDFLTLSRKVG